MNQIKYLGQAGLMLLCLIAGFAILKKSSSEKVLLEGDPVVIDYTTTELSNSTAYKGKSIYQQNCQSCHAINKIMTGPALNGFTKRGPWIKKENIYKWIHNPSAFMAKDSYTKNLQKEYEVIMQAFPQLSKEDIDEIIEYIEYASLPQSSLPASMP